MMRALAPAALAALLAAGPAAAESLAAARTIRAHEIVGPNDLTFLADTVPGALTRPEDAVGLEARVVLYAGRPIRPGDLGPPALVERNGTVTLVYRTGGLTISTEGRALGRAGVGDEVRVLNTSSRATVTGRVEPDGSVLVGGGPGF